MLKRKRVAAYIRVSKDRYEQKSSLKNQKEQILQYAREEETVISSGLGELYPKGLLIGTVSKVIKDDYGLFQEIEITPSVDFSKLEEVLIIQRTETNEVEE